MLEEVYTRWGALRREPPSPLLGFTLCHLIGPHETLGWVWGDCYHLHYTWESSVQFSRSVVSDSLRPHGLQHARLPCPSPTPGAYSNSCPLSR